MEIKKHFNTFSEAIREGLKLRPQCRGSMLLDGRTCALGAGADAMGFREIELMYGCYPEIEAVYQYLSLGANCPECSEEMDKGTVISHLNDDHLWTRERIADWLESEEEKLGYVLLTEEPHTCNTKDSERTKESFIAA